MESRPGSSTNPNLQSGLISDKPLFGMRNPNSDCFPFNLPSPCPIASSLNPDLPPASSFHGTQRSQANDLPHPHSTKVKIGRREIKRQQASTSTRPLTAGKKPEKGKSSALAMAIPPPPCTECGRQFKTPKALYGHMRCHPERKWRGMKPTPQIPVEDSVNPAMLENTDEAIQAAINIVLLANGEYEEWMEEARENISKKRNGGSEISVPPLMTDPYFVSDLGLDLELRLGHKEELKNEMKKSNGALSSKTESSLPQVQIDSNLNSTVDLELRLGFGLGSSNAEY